MMGCRYGAKNTLDLELSVPGGKARGTGLSRNQGGRCKATGGRRATAAPATKSARCKSTALDSPPPSAIHLSRRGVLRVRAGHDGTAVPAQGERLVACHQRPSGQACAHEFRVAYRGADAGCAEDLSQGIAIGSGVYIDENTHIEAVRYPSGSDAMGLLTTILTRWPSRCRSASGSG